MRDAGPSRLRLLALLFTFGVVASRPCSAALVVFEDGGHLHVVGFEVQEDRIELELEGGGRMGLPLSRVDRIVDDEFDPRPEEPPPALASRAVEAPSVRWAGVAPTPTAPAAPNPTPNSVAPFATAILEAARQHRIDPRLIEAVIAVESNFSPRAVSRKGARGLMQLMPATARRLNVTRPFDPKENVRGGTAYLSELADRFGHTEVDLILAAYNAGEGAVERYGGVPPYRETREYVKRVRAIWDRARSG